jgi:REP-associated tyrosine transposase
VRPGLPTLRDRDVVREIEAAFRRGSDRGEFRLVHYSIQADHAHLIVEANGADALGRGMKSLASLFAFAVNRALGRTGRVLADRYHLRILTCPRQVRNAIAYVLLNARKHAAQRIGRLRRTGLANVPALSRDGRVDFASSGRWFEGWRRPVTRDGSAPAVANPRTWFLRTGWRMHGLIDPNETPVHA